MSSSIGILSRELSAVPDSMRLLCLTSISDKFLNSPTQLPVLLLGFHHSGRGNCTGTQVSWNSSRLSSSKVTSSRKSAKFSCGNFESIVGGCEDGARGLVLRASATETAEIREDEEDVESVAVKAPSKLKPSGQLARWARARKLRSAGKTSIESRNEVALATENSASQDQAEATELAKYAEPYLPEDGYFYGGAFPDDCPVKEKSIFMVSDGTGWTADHSVQAALGQFEHCLVDQHCSVNTHLFSDVKEERLMEIIRQAGQEEAMLVFTLADPAMAASAKQACEMLRVPYIDLLGPITDALGAHLGVTPSGLPRGAPGRKTQLSKQYFKRIEAVEFTIKQDDGALPKNLNLADIVLVGVSRTSKTPLSTYMAQKGYKVANVPLVLGIDPPKELFQIDQKKIFGLTINANFLKSIRLARHRQLGVAEESRRSYSDMEHIRKELEYSRKLFAQNPRWPVVEVTGKAIEETAAVILRLYHESHNKYSMPRISSRLHKSLGVDSHRVVRVNANSSVNMFETLVSDTSLFSLANDVKFHVEKKSFTGEVKMRGRLLLACLLLANDLHEVAEPGVNLSADVFGILATVGDHEEDLNLFFYVCLVFFWTRRRGTHMSSKSTIEQ
ncbi:hypothetical protein R1flu_021854 [Riccia fluitans]|uniref:Uncharacterized protein n=1 Tax=Riccia fluitans TaxID=41844 RepID=A0ABD1ZSA9_9MARC